MKRAIFFICIITFFINSVNAVDLEGKWHEGDKCVGCHNAILSESSSKRINDGCLCHYPPEDPVWYNKVDIRSVKDIHGTRTCIKCHVNSIAVSSKENLHEIHSATECEKCHGNENVIKPSYVDCSSCHESEIHGIHDIENLCIICHGKFGEDALQKFKSASVAVSTNVPQIPEKKPFPTVIDLLRSIMQWFKLS